MLSQLKQKIKSVVSVMTLMVLIVTGVVVLPYNSALAFAQETQTQKDTSTTIPMPMTQSVIDQPIPMTQSVIDQPRNQTSSCWSETDCEGKRLGGIRTTTSSCRRLGGKSWELDEGQRCTNL